MNSEMMIKLELKDNSYIRVLDSYQQKIIGLHQICELPLHILLQKSLQQNRVVIHLHQTFIISAIYASIDLQKLASAFTEINRYTRVAPTVPNTPPISEELELASIQALGLNLETGNINYDIIGIVVIAENTWSAFKHV